MWKNYLKTAYRRFTREKVYTLVNTSSLALGIACAVLLTLFVRHEWSYNGFHEHAERIVRVNTITKKPGSGQERTAETPAPLAEDLRGKYPAISKGTRIAHRPSVEAFRQQTSFDIEAAFVDSTFLDVFTFPATEGAPKEVLSKPNEVVLTRQAARRMFGDQSPVGRSLSFQLKDKRLEYTVGGIVQTPPPNSSLQFGVLFPLGDIKYTYPPIARGQVLQSTSNLSVHTFLLLQSRSQVDLLQKTFSASLFERYKEDSNIVGFRLEPLTQIHLSPEIQNALGTAVNPTYLWILLGISLLVLIVACINFTAISLGLSVKRSKEVGVRRSVGALGRQIQSQFWGESILLSAIAALLGLVLSALFLPVLNQLLSSSLRLSYFFRPGSVLVIVVLVALTGVLGGGYPSLVLSRLDPTTVLRGGTGRNTERASQRTFIRTAAAAQYALSIGLVIVVLCMTNQLRFLQNKDLGFNEENTIFLTGAGLKGSRIYPRFRQQVRDLSSIKEVTASGFHFGYKIFSIELQNREGTSVNAYTLPVKGQFTQVMQIDVIRGRPLRRGESTGALVNEALAKALGNGENVVGKPLPFPPTSPFKEALGELRIVGVVENFHYRSLRHKIQPLLLVPAGGIIKGGARNIIVRLQPDASPQRVLARLRKAWERVAPNTPFQYNFADEAVAQTYRNERRQRAIAGYGSIFALIVAGIGLFGLATLETSRRRQEIGIRKSFGASTGSVVLTLTKDFFLLVAVAFAIAAPIAYVAVRRWLQNFAYHYDLGLPVFLIAGALAATVASLSVGYQTYRAATTDPVDAIRGE